MGKGKDAKKATKKPPTKTAKEKKAAKKLKKTNKENWLSWYILTPNDSPAKPSNNRWFFVFITLILVYYHTKQENKSRLMTSKEI